MRLVILLLLFTSNFSLASETMDLGEFNKKSLIIDVNNDSPDEINLDFTLNQRVKFCKPEHKRYTNGNSLFGKKLGCYPYSYEDRLNAESATIILEKSSAVLNQQKQRLQVDIYHPKQYSADYKIEVKVLEGPKDTITFEKGNWSGNYTFRVQTQE